MSANALTVDVTGTAANGVEVRGGTTTIGADSHISSAQGGGLVTSGSDATINFSGTAAQRNSIFSSGLSPDGNGCYQHAKYRYYG
ncbi:outer membrane autotransporter/adhesion protein [Escherichia coli]|uniref:Outer membrane autotransporter/adhesion protein n=1 Tax=Escherichia coli TaxID=562 RepID=A0A377D304_ECOLX|nr:outer membrane autotransporter/adhesion protein [Escherichia coli]